MKTKHIILLMIAMILIASNVMGIGISPGSKVINFEPSQEQDISFKVLNNEKKEMRVLLNTEGELAQYITLSNILIDFKATEESKEFTYKIKLPSQIEKPGTHSAEIIALELPTTAEQPGTYIKARIGVVSRLDVQVPYPGQYAEAKLSISKAQVGESTTFIVKVFNYGTEYIKSAQASIDILGPTNELITTLQTNGLAVKAKDIREVTTTYQFQNPGRYHAIARLRYDGKITRDEKTFSIGNVAIELVNVEVKNFRLEGIAKFDLLLENKWNDIINNVYAEIRIRDKVGNELGNFKSVSTNIPALAQETVVAYWDTENVKSDQYDATITINYEDGKKTEKQFKADVSIDSIRLSAIDGTGQIISSEGEIFSSSIIALLIGVLIIINIAWFIYFKRRLKKKPEE